MCIRDRIGGVREKVLAAKNFGLTRVILPKANEPDAKELKRELVRGIRFFFVEHFDEVREIVFGGTAKKRAANKRATKKATKRSAAKKASSKRKAVAKKGGKKAAKKTPSRRRRS